MKLPKVTQNKLYDIKRLTTVMLSLHKDVVIDLTNVEIEYYETWDFYKISIFRWSKCSSGCGTKEYRDELWKEHVKTFIELFEMKYPPKIAWRFKTDTVYYDLEIETTKNNIIPGFTFFVST